MTSFKAMTTSTKGITGLLEVTDKDRYLSYLPISHGMERWCGECIPLMTGEEIFYAESLATFVVSLATRSSFSFEALCLATACLTLDLT